MLSNRLKDLCNQYGIFIMSATQLNGQYKDSETLPKEVNELKSEIAKGHNYIFVGKVGQFCPIKPGCNGGLLMREKDGKYYSATGSKGYRLLESELVKTLGKENDVDKSYYTKLVDDAIDAISEFGDFEWFVSDEPMPKKKQDTLPWSLPCGETKYKTCFDCPKFIEDKFHMNCGLNYDISDHIALMTKKNNLKGD